IELFRNEELNLEQLSAFTVSDDHAEQERVWNSLAGSCSRQAHNIRTALTEQAIRSSDKRIRFIGGFEAYEAAGGAVKRDLFDDHNQGFALDAALVDALVDAKLQETADAVTAEGWAWVETARELPHHRLSEFTRVYPVEIEPSEEVAAEIARLEDERERLSVVIETGQAEDDDEAEAALDRIASEIDALSVEAYQPSDLERAGAIVGIDYYGKLEVWRGLVRREASGLMPVAGGNADTKPTTGKAPALHSAVLIEDLTAQKTAAIRAELAQNTHVALASVVHALLLQTVLTHASDCTCLEIRLTSQPIGNSMKNPEGNLALEALAVLRERFGDQVPGEPAAIFAWCLERTQDELLELLAFACAQSVNAVQDKYDFRKQARVHADKLAAALNLDMRNYFEATAESYFKHLSRDGIEVAITEAKGKDFADGIARMKKAEAAAYAENAIKGTGWLPSPLRTAGVVSMGAGDNVECDGFDNEVLCEAAE
ncbi:hypothetical protein BTE77_34650, partial [Ensifer adhaerens]